MNRLFIYLTRHLVNGRTSLELLKVYLGKAYIFFFNNKTKILEKYKIKFGGMICIRIISHWNFMEWCSITDAKPTWPFLIRQRREKMREGWPWRSQKIWGSFPLLSYLSQSVQEIVMVIKRKFSTEFHGEDAWVRWLPLETAWVL